MFEMDFREFELHEVYQGCEIRSCKEGGKTYYEWTDEFGSTYETTSVRELRKTIDEVLNGQKPSSGKGGETEK